MYRTYCHNNMHACARFRYLCGEIDVFSFILRGGLIPKKSTKFLTFDRGTRGTQLSKIVVHVYAISLGVVLIGTVN